MQVIGIKTFTESIKIKEQKEHDIDVKNKKITTRNLIILIVATFVSIIISVIHNIYFAGAGNISTAFSAQYIPVYISFFLGSIIISVCFMDQYYCLNTISQYPLTYQYAFYTNNKTVLKYKVEQCCGSYFLKMHLEDNQTKEVSYNEIGPFTIKEKTDITETIFDLENDLVYIPYRQNSVD